MTDDKNDQADSVNGSGAKSSVNEWVSKACSFLHSTDPAMLLLWSGLAILVAALLTYFGLQFRFGLNAASALGLWQTGEHTSVFSSETQRSPLPPVLGTVMASIGFLFGIIGTLLPMWSVGRLIADALKSGGGS